jgi:hypothetical protein
VLYQQSESAMFLGDSSFWKILNELLAAEPPLLVIKGAERLDSSMDDKVSLSLDDFGRQVLAGEKSALDAIGVDRWIGGVHLQQNHLWLWQEQVKRLIVPDSNPGDNRQ